MHTGGMALRARNDHDNVNDEYRRRGERAFNNGDIVGEHCKLVRRIRRRNDCRMPHLLN